MVLKINYEGIFVIGMKVKGTGWEVSHIFMWGRFGKEEIRAVKAVRASNGGIVIVE